jgi:outer membrane biosynthesis protein TonB
VNVKVRVAESGAVMLAEVEDYGDPPNWRLAAAALDAARRWTFEPARVEDTAVPSDVILHFRFTP